MSAAATIRPILDRQRAAHIAALPVDAATRKARIQRVIDLLVKHNDALCNAMSEDFGGRPAVFSMLNDVVGSLGMLKHARDKLQDWMADEPRTSPAPFDSFGASAWVRYQPKGVVGIIGSWNSPLFTLLSPLASVFAAGNRAVLKPSEVTARTAEVLAAAVAEFFDTDELAVVNGRRDVTIAFSEQPWDHLVYTGSTTVGRQMMHAAAQNLVPLTLELGGKSPVLVGRSADIRNAAERIAVGKGTNSGQICVSPDAVWVPQERREEFLAAVREVYLGLYPRAASNPDVVPVVNTRHVERVERYVRDAQERGARVEVIGDAAQLGSADRRLPLRVVVEPPAEAEIAHEEIFGPAFVLRGYRDIGDVVAEINAGPRPLALYYFGNDAAEQKWVLDHTLSGGVAINDVLMHAAVADAPFGGIGASGMGHYHGREGFLQFSHTRTVYRAGAHDPRREWGMLPPYQEAFVQMIRAAVTP